MKHLRSLLLLTAIGIFSNTSVYAQVEGATVDVYVRAESRIDLEWITDGKKLKGRVQDDLGRPLAARDVTIEMFGQDDGHTTARATSDEDGYFWVDRPLDFSPPIRAQARFEGDDDYESSYVTLQSDRATPKPRLRVRIADPIDLGAPHVALKVRVGEDDRPVRALVQVSNELGHLLASKMVDGEADLELDSRDLGPPGDGRLIVETTSTARWASRRTETPIRRRIRPSLTLESHGAQNSRAELCGVLFDQFGPLADRVVEIHRQQDRVATLRTNSKGSFCGRVELLDESAHFVASFGGDGRGRWPAKSQALLLNAVATGTKQPAWLGPLLTLFLGLLGWAALTRRTARDGLHQYVQTPAKAGVRTATPQRLRADRSDVGLRVLALDLGQPLAGATVRLEKDLQRVELTTDRSGRVAVENLGRGTWTLEVCLEPGYVLEKSALTVPHRGQWSNAEMYLRSIRQQADVIWTGLASRLSGSDVQHLTQREIAALPQLKKAQDLACDVEAATYASPNVDAECLTNLQKRANAVQNEADGPIDASQSPEK